VYRWVDHTSELELRVEAASEAAVLEEAGAALAEFVRPGDLVLVKGSRGVHTEKVVEALKERYEVSDK
jgi:UDP-N-acetylmuramyl pentapeptide synthase